MFFGEIRSVFSDRRRWIAAVLAVSLLSAALWWLFCLPKELFGGVPCSTVVLSAEGELLGARTAADGQWRFPPSDTVSPRYAVCLTQFEDRRFYTHHGVSIPAIVRAALQNLRAGRTVSGGSTVTMQVIRLHRSATADSLTVRGRTFSEKIIEAILAARLELRCDKNGILALYAANAPFGGNVVGIEAASWRYFGRPSSNLSWAEAATLAVLPNSPSLIRPGRNSHLLEAKRNRLLRRLYNIGVIDSRTCELACSEPLPSAPYPLPQTASHLVEEYDRTMPGRMIRTDIDIALQLRLEGILNRWNDDFTRSGISDLAAVVVDVRTGGVIAYCGNANASDGREGAFVDIAAAPRSTGSILKPFLYEALLQRGDILPHTLIADVPVSLGGFSPQNFDLHFSGAVPASEALARSLNVPSVNMLRMYGVRNFHQLLRKSGMTTLTRPPEDYGLSLILGGAEGRLREVTGIYAAMSAYYQGFSFWLPPEWPMTDRCALFYVFDTLKELNRPDEMDWRMVPSLQKIAWKTGTSYGFRDAWAVGVNRSYAVGVWAGNADGRPAPGLVGARTAGPVMFDIFNALPSSPWFDEPGTGEYAYAEVCRRSGRLKGRFCDECDSLIVPAACLRSRICPYHRPVPVTADGRNRLSSPSEGGVVRNFFVLPPAMEWYYRKVHGDYVPVPPPLVRNTYGHGGASSPMEFIYPEADASVFIPSALDGGPGEIVFSLAHSNPEAEVFWHLDSSYLGSTRIIHQFGCRPSSGNHTLTAVDSFGNAVSVGFFVEN